MADTEAPPAEAPAEVEAPPAEVAPEPVAKRSPDKPVSTTAMTWVTKTDDSSIC